MEILLEIMDKATPIGVAAGLVVIIWHLVKGRSQVSTLTENHLHGLPTMQQSLVRIEESSIRQEAAQARQELALREIVTVLRERKQNG